MAVLVSAMRRSLLVGAVLCVACSGSKHATSVQLEWQPLKDEALDCRLPDLLVTVGAAEGSTVKIQGQPVAPPAHGAYELTLPGDAVGDASSISVDIERAGKVEHRTVAVPPREPPELALSYQHNRPAHEVWSGDLTLTVAGKQDRTSWGAAADEQGMLVMPLPCGAVAGTPSQGTFRVIKGTPSVLVDPGDALADLSLKRVPLALTIALPDGAKIDLTGKVNTGALAVVRYRAVTTRPLASAPAFQASRGQPLLMVWPDRVELIGKGTPADAALVAVVTRNREVLKPCGPYGREAAMMTRFRSDTTVVVHEARTGSKLVESSFTGAVPTCPRSTTVMTIDGASAGVVQQVIGDDPSAAIRKWVASVAASPAK